MKKFWNWIHDDGGGRILRLDARTSKPRTATSLFGLTRPAGMSLLPPRSIPC